MTVTMGDWVWDEGFDMGAGGGQDEPPSEARSDHCKKVLLDTIEHETACES